MTIDQLVGENVRRAREAARLSLRELTQRVLTVGIEMTETSLQVLERGERRIGIDELLALGLSLDAPPATLLSPLTLGTLMRVDMDEEAGASWALLREAEAQQGSASGSGEERTGAAVRSESLVLAATPTGGGRDDVAAVPRPTPAGVQTSPPTATPTTPETDQISSLPPIPDLSAETEPATPVLVPQDPEPTTPAATGDDAGARSAEPHRHEWFTQEQRERRTWALAGLEGLYRSQEKPSDEYGYRQPGR